jgi:hypothetical protein
MQNTNDNIMINSLAGTGKTKILEMGERVINVKPILYLVFNKKNKQEAEEKMLSTTTVRTINGCGYNIWKGACDGDCTVDTKKSGNILRSLINESPKQVQNELWSVYWEVLSAVALAKAYGYVPDGKFLHVARLCDRETFATKLEETPDDLVLDLVDEVLTRSIQASYAGSIDFDDQVYMPALFGGTFPKFPLVAVDERQDFSPINDALLDKLVKHRLICVGDPWQNIYGFRGAQARGMHEAVEKYNMVQRDLSISFRCPEAVVRAAQWRVPHFKWYKTGGHVERLEQMAARDFPESAAIICRNNAPLFRLGMQLLSSGRAVSIAGSDIGPRVAGLLRKLGSEDTPRATLISAIEDWRAEKLAKESTTANDTADCLRVFAEHGANLAQAIAYAEDLFKQTGSLKLLTGHKSKGLEFDTVYLLDTFLLRSDEQDLNLRYVMQTRSASHLYEIDSNNIVW